MLDVITVGSSTIDAFACVESELIKIKTINHEEDLIAYPSGSKILIKELTFYTGGGGTNTAVALSRLGLSVGYIGKVGMGTNSGLILNTLKKENVKFFGSKSKSHHAGYSVILDSLEGDRTILAYKGANNYLKFDEIDKKKLKTRWFYFSSMVGESFETLEKLAFFAEKNKIKIAFNPSNYLAEKGFLYLKEILVRTDILILNREEAWLLGGKLDTADLIKKLMELGPKRVVITDGKNGAFTIEKDLVHVKTTGIKSKETTGAGDAFASTFLAGIILNKKIDDCMRMACLNAEAVISEVGAKSGLMTTNALKKKLARIKPKVEHLKA